MEYLSPEFWGFVAILMLLLLFALAFHLRQKMEAKKPSQNLGKDTQKASSEPLQKECKDSPSAQPTASSTSQPTAQSAQPITQSTSQTKPETTPEKIDSHQTSSSAKPVAVTLPHTSGMRGSRPAVPSAEVLAKFGIESVGSGSSYTPRYKSFAPKRTTHFR